MGDDEGLMKTIHFANIACGFHASDFNIMNKTVELAKKNGVKVGAHPSLPDLQGFGRREMAIEPAELMNCFMYQVGALSGFLKLHGLSMNHVKPHGAIYGQTARSLPLSRAVIDVIKVFQKGQKEDIAFMGMPGTAHQTAAEEAGVKFIAGMFALSPRDPPKLTTRAEWFADLDYSPEGKLIITQKHEPVSLEKVRGKVQRLLNQHEVTTLDGYLPLGNNVTEVSICCHSDTPGAVEIAQLVKATVEESNKAAGYD